jgi:4-azaleucine resistance transporter AzlC
MSVLVFAGAAQFVALSLLISGSSFLLILLITFVINSRYFLMGASLGPYTRRWNVKWQSILSFLLSDESYAMTISYFAKNAPSKYYQLGVSLGLYVEWAAFSIVGGLLGSFLDDPQTWGLDFALPATFIVILMPMIKTWQNAIVCIITGVFSIVGFTFLPTKWYIPFAAVSGTIVGGVLEIWKRK